MAQQQLTFSKNIHFTGLDADPNEVQPATLIWEIENDSTLSAALIDVRFSQIDVIAPEPDGQGADDDQIVVLELRKNSSPISWSELTGGEQAALLAVFAAHTGTPTIADEQAILDNGTDSNSDTGTWDTKTSLTTAPLVAGKYRVEATGEHMLQSTPATHGVQRVQSRLVVNDGGGDSTVAVDTNHTEFPQWFNMIATVNVREGQTVEAKVEYKPTGASSPVAEIKRTRLRFVPLEGTEV